MTKKTPKNSNNKMQTRSSFASKNLSGQPVQLQKYYRNKEMRRKHKWG